MLTCFPDVGWYILGNVDNFGRSVTVFYVDDYREGALAVLRRCVEERMKIKVWTRNYRYVRGICIGYLVAFDKHWNLVRVCAI